jgi:hypothetical protein
MIRYFKFILGCPLLVLVCLQSHTVQAHHSFAVHFVADKIISVSGTATGFRFTNPHGLVFLTVTTPAGEQQEWRAETNSPSVLRRRGWSKDSIKTGDTITIEGYPARDGSNVLRISRVIFPDGKVLPGQGRVLSAAPASD